MALSLASENHQDPCILSCNCENTCIIHILRRAFDILHSFSFSQVKALLKERLSGKTAGGGSNEKSEPNASEELNSRNFDELVIKSKDLWIVEFFAPW